MSLDVIEIALDQFTDWVLFEKLCLEVMRDEGFPDIRPLGGRADEGQDAVVERLYLLEGRRLRIVFQFTLRSDAPTKVSETIRRLDEAGVSFQKLILVTRATVSAETQRELKKRVARDHEVDLDIYERKTLIKHLADFSNGLFHRFFPNLPAQIATLFRLTPSRDTSQQRERALLRVSVAFTLSPRASRTRKSLLDYTVLGLVSLATEPVSAEDVLVLSRQALGERVLREIQQIAASLERLTKSKFVVADVARYTLSADGRARLEGATVALDAVSLSVVSDLAEEVLTASGGAVSDVLRTRLQDNARLVLAEYFRIAGLELASFLLNRDQAAAQVGPVYLTETPRLLEMAQRGLGAHLGNLLLTAIGRALSTPTVEQAQYLAGCSRSYLALAAMNLDPALREFQASRFSTKTFVLDTDVVLDAIVEDMPLCRLYRALVAQLVGLGIKVVVPEEVFTEVVTHFEIAPSTFNYFGGSLAGLNEALVKARVWNVLVKGYWYRSSASGRFSRSEFMEYRENYFESARPLAFVTDLVREALPGVQVGPLANVFGVQSDSGEVEVAGRVFMSMITGTRKGADRTAEQNRELADRDARLYTAVTAYNAAVKPTPEAILGARAYILTSSGRYARVAAALGVEAHHSARPQLVLGLLEMIGSTAMDDRDYVALFENSLLHQTVEACWEDVKILLDAGIDLRSKGLTRLRHDVDEQLHELISRLREADEAAETEVDSGVGDREHGALLDAAESMGYRATDLLAKLRTEGKAKDADLAKLGAENAQLQEAVVRFGRKRARWLRRLRRQQERSG